MTHGLGKALVDLRIPSDWKAIFNNYVVINDPKKLTDSQCDIYLSQDLLSIERNEEWIDVGWHPDGDRNGAYRLTILNKQHGWDDPLLQFESPVQQQITEAIELCFRAFDQQLPIESWRALTNSETKN